MAQGEIGNKKGERTVSVAIKAEKYKKVRFVLLMCVYDLIILLRLLLSNL